MLATLFRFKIERLFGELQLAVPLVEEKYTVLDRNFFSSPNVHRNFRKHASFEKTDLVTLLPKVGS